MKDDDKAKLSDLIELWHSEPLNRQQLAMFASLLLMERKELKQQLDQWKNMACEYSDCLQKLCMDRLYDICRPVSHGWPGKPHVVTIVEGVEFLIQQLAAAKAENERIRNAIPDRIPVDSLANGNQIMGWNACVEAMEAAMK